MKLSEDEIEELTEERDSLRDLFDRSADLNKRVMTENRSLTERVAVLEEALRPLAAIAKYPHWGKAMNKNFIMLWAGKDAEGNRIALTLANAIKAKEAMDG